MATYVNGIPVYSDTSWNRTYYWFAENVGWLATAKSLMNDTTLNFTRSDCHTILVAEHAGAIAEETRGKPRVSGLPSLVRGVLLLPGDMTEFGSAKSDRVPGPLLLDVSGRSVMDLVPGRNDLGRVAPGVYYVAGGPARHRFILAR